MTWLGEEEMHNLARGASVLASGGGGDTNTGLYMALAAVRRMGPVRLLSPYELPDDALVLPAAFIGSPMVQDEKIPGHKTLSAPIRALEAHLGRQANALALWEVGGRNCLVTLAMAAACSLPVVDGDGFGRALPELQMQTYGIYGNLGSPMAVVNECGDEVLIRARDNMALNHLAQSTILRFGGIAYAAGYAMEGRRFKESAVLYTVSLAERIGRAMHQAEGNLRETLLSIAEATANSTYGRAVVLAEGEVIGMERFPGNGWGRGLCTILCSRGRRVRLHFQNEFLFAEVDGEPLGMVPDILVAMEADSVRPLSTDEVVTGQRLLLLGIPAPEILRTERALQVIGPRAFGYDFDYEPLESLKRGEGGGL